MIDQQRGAVHPPLPIFDTKIEFNLFCRSNDNLVGFPQPIIDYEPPRTLTFRHEIEGFFDSNPKGVGVMAVTAGVTTEEDTSLALLICVVTGLVELDSNDQVHMLIGSVGRALLDPTRGVSPHVGRIADALRDLLKPDDVDGAGKRLVEFGQHHRLHSD